MPKNPASSEIVARYVKTWHHFSSWIDDEDWLMEQVIHGKVSAGRVVLPAELRKEFGIKDGAEVVFSRTEHGIEIKTLDEVIREAQELCARYVKPGVSLVDELLRERREEAARE